MGSCFWPSAYWTWEDGRTAQRVQRVKASRLAVISDARCAESFWLETGVKVKNH